MAINFDFFTGILFTNECCFAGRQFCCLEVWDVKSRSDSTSSGRHPTSGYDQRHSGPHLETCVFQPGLSGTQAVCSRCLNEQSF